MNYITIAREYNVSVRFLTEEEVKGYHSYNCAYHVGKDEIAFGKVDNKEFEMLSFFHELAHIINEEKFDCTQFWYEFNTWIYAIEFSKTKYGMTWSDEALKFAMTSCLTYYHEKDIDN